MIVKIKTFSGDVLCLPEEDYLQELMYSDEPAVMFEEVPLTEEEQKALELSNREKEEAKRRRISRIKKGAGLAGAAGIGALGGALIGGRTGNKTKKGKRYWEVFEKTRDRIDDYCNANDLEGVENMRKRQYRIADLQDKYKLGRIKKGALIGAAVAPIAAYGGYKLYKHYKNKKKQQQENDSKD